MTAATVSWGGACSRSSTLYYWLRRNGVRLEIVTLLVPGFNDSDPEVRSLTEFLAGVAPDIPWHVTAFHQDYKMVEPDNTTPAMLTRAAAIGRTVGLRYVYAGNIPVRVGGLEHTHCHECGEYLIRRHGYLIQESGIPPHPRRELPAVHDEDPLALERRVRGPARGVSLSAPRPDTPFGSAG
jgi:hypothetical protein